MVGSIRSLYFDRWMGWSVIGLYGCNGAIVLYGIMGGWSFWYVIALVDGRVDLIIDQWKDAYV